MVLIIVIPEELFIEILNHKTF